jgi:hypothetical protein
MAVNLAKMLTEKGDSRLAERLLLDATGINPFNTEVWFGLKKGCDESGSPLKKARLLALLAERIRTAAEDAVEEEEHAANTDFSQVENEGGSEHDLKNETSTYVNHLSWELGGVKPGPERAANRQALDILQPYRDSALFDIRATIARLRISVVGWRSEARDVLEKTRASFDPSIKVATGKELVGQCVQVIEAAKLAGKTDPDYIRWLKDMTAVSERQPHYKRFRRKVYFDPLYKLLMPNLLEALKESGRRDEHREYSDRLKAAETKLWPRPTEAEKK